jgi:2-succinyl-5-enolpyruvyl-6-hydroxy-3-cyclohexene-1-carboxylate synthase
VRTLTGEIMTATATDSYLVIRALLDEFVRCGMRHACTSPGSRNTPIVLSMARERRLKAWSHVDERAAGFFALGAAKASGRPVAVTCTSGTAAANLLPAVIEAREAGLPLIVLTADRPPELRDIGAGQTIDQIKLYGDAVKWFVELGVPEATPERMRWVRSLACRAYWTAASGRPGPVHINMPLREPLVLEQLLPEDEPGGGGRADGAPWVEQHVSGPDVPALPRLHEFRRTVFIVGDLGPEPGLGARLAAFAARARVPLLADPLSGARSGPAAIAHFDLILRDPATAAALRPDVVCRIGDLPTSKPLRAWLAGLDDAIHVQFTPDERWIDPVSRTGSRIVGSLADLVARVESDEVAADDSDWLDRWCAADSAVAHAIAEPLLAAGLSEPAAITALGQFLPAGATLFVGASMPIRDVEEFFPALNEPPRVLANRGANGIDGTVSSAFGVAAATGSAEVVLLLGDVTLAHDIGGLLAARRLGLKLTIVLLNNDGGGIFNFLAVSSEGEAFEQHIATPTGLDFSQAAVLYGCGYQRVGDIDELAGALMRSLAGPDTTIIEVRTDRVANRELHADVEAAALASLSETSA